MSITITPIHDFEWEKAYSGGLIKQYFKTNDPIADINEIIDEHAFFADYVIDWFKSSGLVSLSHSKNSSTDFDFIELYIRQLFASHIYATLVEARMKIIGNTSKRGVLRCASFTKTVNFSRSAVLRWQNLLEDELPEPPRIRLVLDENENIVEKVIARGAWLH